MKEYQHIKYRRVRLSTEAQIANSEQFREMMSTRRSVRHFSRDPVSKEVVENVIMTAASAPSGANKQPWTFCAISAPEMKKKIRLGAEEEEKLNYGGRMSDSWLEDLAPFDTNWEKPFLEDAPWLIVVFKKPYEESREGKQKNYYVNESVGLAVGILLTAIHQAGLVTLTHTPSPMNFLEKILHRPANERAFLLLPVGYPAADATVPDLQRKTREEVLVWYE